MNKWETAKWSATKESDTNDIDNFINSINNKFISKGIAVNIDEFKSIDKNGNTAARVDYTINYISN